MFRDEMNTWEKYHCAGTQNYNLQRETFFRCPGFGTLLGSMTLQWPSGFECVAKITFYQAEEDIYRIVS